MQGTANEGGEIRLSAAVDGAHGDSAPTLRILGCGTKDPGFSPGPSAAQLLPALLAARTTPAAQVTPRHRRWPLQTPGALSTSTKGHISARSPSKASGHEFSIRDSGDARLRGGTPLNVGAPHDSSGRDRRLYPRGVTYSASAARCCRPGEPAGLEGPTNERRSTSSWECTSPTGSPRPQKRCRRCSPNTAATSRPGWACTMSTPPRQLAQRRGAHRVLRRPRAHAGAMMAKSINDVEGVARAEDGV